MKSILITIAISVYMTFTVVTIQVANKQTLATSDVTLDMITVMSRAFDESEGGETTCPGVTQDEVGQNLNWWCSNGQSDFCVISWFLWGGESPIETYMYWRPGSSESVDDVYCLPDVVINP